MKALFVTGTLGCGGAEGHSVTLVNRLASRGHECHAVHVKASDTELLARLESAASVRGLEGSRYLDRAAAAAFARHVARLRPSVVLAANPYALLYARLAVQRAGVPAVLAASFHTTVPASRKEWLQLACYRPLFWTADCLVFVCEAQRRYWRRRMLHARRNEVIYNGVDAEHWRPRAPSERSAIRGALGFAERDYVVGLCGKLRPEKNHLQLVEAVAALRARGVAARALFVGDGPTRGTVEARARSLGVSADVLVTGFKDDVRPLLGACDVVVLCSVAVETLSIAALEAMALERPVVHSDIGGAAEMIRPGENGFLFPVGDTGALVERLAALAGEEARRRMGVAARATVEQRFSERAMVDRYETLLLDLESARRNRENLRTSAPAH